MMYTTLNRDDDQVAVLAAIFVFIMVLTRVYCIFN